RGRHPDDSPLLRRQEQARRVRDARAHSSRGRRVVSDDVVIVGAGIMGSAIARELARAGRTVRVLEKSIPGAEASSVAAGILAPLVEHEDGPLRELGCASREAYALLADALREETGVDIGFVRSGVLRVAFDDRLETTGGERLSGAQARELE